MNAHRIPVRLSVMTLAVVVLVACIAATSSADSASNPATHASATGSTEACGTRTVYGHKLPIRVHGKSKKELPGCSRVRKIISGQCKSHDRWTCFSEQPPGPFLIWFPTKEMFNRHFSTEIRAVRYPCSKARISRRLWNARTQRFPTRRQLLADDIIRCGLLDGKTSSQVAAILGTGERNSSQGRTYRDYPIGDERDSFFQLDEEILSISFDHGVFRSASIYQS